MKKLIILALLSAHAEAAIIAPDGGVTYVNPIAGGYSTINATTGNYTTYMQSGNLTTVVPDNGLGEAQTYITTEGEQPLILDQAGEE